MKKLFIIYNILFLFSGNVLFSNIHYFHSHSHNHSHDHETVECQDCIIFEDSNKYILDFDKVNFSSNNFNKFIAQYFINIELDFEKVYLSRAPPIL